MQSNKLTPNKSKKKSPIKSNRDSASKSKQSPSKESSEHFTMETKFELEDENDKSGYSLEGIAGMVRITPGKD